MPGVFLLSASGGVKENTYKPVPITEDRADVVRMCPQPSWRPRVWPAPHKGYGGRSGIVVEMVCGGFRSGVLGSTPGVGPKGARMAFGKDWKEVVMTDDELKLLDTPYRDLSMDDRAKALSRVQKDYGDTVLTVVTQLLSTNMGLTMREAVMKETGSWPQWPDPKKRRGRSVKPGATTSATPIVDQPKAEKPEPSMTAETETCGDLDNLTRDEFVDRGVKLCDQAYVAAVGIIRLGYLTHQPALVDMAAGVVSNAAACRSCVERNGKVLTDGR